MLRYTDEVRKITKQCYDEVWEALQTRKEALWAGIKALSEQKEMLGEELVSARCFSFASRLFRLWGCFVVVEGALSQPAAPPLDPLLSTDLFHSFPSLPFPL